MAGPHSAVERDLFILTVLNNLGRPVNIGEFTKALKESGVETDSRELGHWLRAPLSAGHIRQTGEAGGLRFPGGGYQYCITEAGQKFIKRELDMVNDLLSQPSTPGPGVLAAAKDKESGKGKKESSTRLIGGSFLMCLSFLAFLYAGDARFRNLLERWWTKQMGVQKPKAPPETPPIRGIIV